MFIDALFTPYAIVLLLLIVLIIGGVIFARKDSLFIRVAAIVIGALPLLYFFSFLFIHIVDVPFSDDYNLLDSFIRLLNANGWQETTSVLFEQVNQHRFAFERTVMLFLYSLSGDFSVKTHIIVGNLSLIGITWLFYQFFKTKSFPLYYFIPIPLTIFSLVFYENATWSIAALQNTPILFFALLTSYLVAKPNRFLLAILCAVVTTFISGNGISIWIVGSIILLLQEKNRRLLTWIIIASGILCFYFLYDYHFYKSEGASILSAPIANFIAISAFWGNIFYGDYSHLATRTVYPDVLLCVINGIALLIIALISLLKNAVDHRANRQPENWIIIGAMLFVLATGCMLIISRPSDWNVIRGGDVFSRRYMIFGMVIALAGYLALLDLLAKQTSLTKLIALSTSILAVVGNLTTYYFFGPKVINAQQELALDTFYIKHHGTLLSVGEVYGEKPFWNHPTTFLNLVKRADSLALFSHPSPSLYESLLNQVPRNVEGATNLRLWTEEEPVGKLTGGSTSKKILMLEYNKAINPAVKYFVFKSKEHEFVVPAILQNIPVHSPNDLFKQAYRYGFRVEKFPANTYEVFMATKTDNNYAVINLGKSIVLQP